MKRRELIATGMAGMTMPVWKRLPGVRLAVQPSSARPSRSQLAWQDAELGMFFHFGVNTFSDREWGDGKESPASFNPTALDARQWVRAAQSAGCKYVVLTAKHHDGFCLWPTRTTDHSVKSSPWRGGEGDVVRELADAAQAAGLGLGVYLSPWDRNAASYGSGEGYNDFYNAQLTELLTNYGRITEVWFDGANGEGPNGKRQRYDWPRIHATVRRLQPDAVMFSDAGPDIRWIGNERGTAGEPNWCTVDPAIVTEPGLDGPEIIRSLQHGDAPPRGTVWRPGEADVSIRPGWFNHPADDSRVKSADVLMDIWFNSVGRNANLLLNVPPGRDGLIAAPDIASLDAFGSRVRNALAPAAETRVTVESAREVSVQLAQAQKVSSVSVQEDLSYGQRVVRYRIGAIVDGAMQIVSAGTTIGHRKIDRFTPVAATGFVVLIDESMGVPSIRSFQVGSV